MPDPTPRILAILVADLDHTWLGTRSRLADAWPTGKTVLAEVCSRTLQIAGIGELILLAPSSQHDRIHTLLGPQDRIRLLNLTPRPAGINARIKAARAWNLLAWRGGAGQFTCFDEEFHPAAIAAAAATAFNNQGAEHILHIHSHSVFLDVNLTAALVQHHLHKNHEMRVTYTPAAPGLSGMVFRADIIKEMGEKNVLPAQLLAYDPKAPAFDTLIRDACMQVDPALSKIPNRFCIDNTRSEKISRQLAAQTFDSSADLCLAAARAVAPGITSFSPVHALPREIEIELTPNRLTQPPGIPPAAQRNRPELDAQHWTHFLSKHPSRHTTCDDLLFTLGGDGDALLYAGDLTAILRAARNAGILSTCVQTDLAGGNVDALLASVAEGLVDVVTVTMYGSTPATYAKVAGADLHATVIKNLERLAESARATGLPIIVPRLLKVRDTIPELEPFFDFWVEHLGWAVIDAPTDKAGTLPFAAVVNMAPPKRRPCRRIWDRLLIRSDGTALACDQDTAAKLNAGHIEQQTLNDMWQRMNSLREQHAAGKWNDISPCNTCKEWHRA